MNRDAWRKYYRAMRVARRECNKAFIDMIIYGSACVFFPDTDGDPVYIPMESIWL